MEVNIMKYNVLIAEDDKDICKILTLYLSSEGYNTFVVNDGKKALNVIEKEQIDIVVLDIMMPLMDGYEVIKELRKTKNIPIIIISAKSNDNDKILGLNIGADDYICKPFNPIEVVARVKAQLRSYYNFRKEENNEIIKVSDLVLNTKTLKLYKNSEEIVVTPNEYKILLLLMKNPERVYTNSQICETINGEYYDNYENTIAVHISHLREKIEDDKNNPRYIINVRGLGYKIENK